MSWSFNKKNSFVISHTYLSCLIKMAQYHNNKEKNNESWSKIIILSCQNEIKNKNLKWTTLMYIYILPVHHCSILGKSFLRRLRNNNIFTLQLSNPDSGLLSGQSYPENLRFPDRLSYMRDMTLYFGAGILLNWAQTLLIRCVLFQIDIHEVSNVSITSRNLWIKYDTVTTLITSW